MSNGEQRLVGLFLRLSAMDQAALLAFAEFLNQRVVLNVAAIPVPEVEELLEPLDIPRPKDERVVAAVKRLSKTYPMLDKNKMLGDTSTLMTAHVMQGKEAAEVVDELESLFRREYELLKSETGSS
ncbi:MAG: Crp/Fnr family transcriptional regulator [Gammaproteobacteria bacterium]